MKLKGNGRMLLVCAASLLLVLGSAAPAYAQPEAAPPDEVQTVSPAPVEEAQPDETGYVTAASNGRYNLDVDMTTGLFILRDREAGKDWYSVPKDVEEDSTTKGAAQRTAVRSQLVIGYVYKSDETVVEKVQAAASSTACVNNGTITVETIPDGVRVTYGFSQLGITIPVEYTLLEDGLRAAILTGSIEEGDDCFLTSINLLPVFGAGNREAEGYLFVPDGSGAIIDFNNNVQMQPAYEAMVYGEELADPPVLKTEKTETVRMPVFGTVEGNHALMGVITKGDGAAAITVMNGNARCGYNAVSSKAVFRILSKQYNLFNKKQVSRVSRVPFGLDTYEVEYYTLAGEEANYTGMAARYRAYLESQGMAQKDTAPSFNLDLLGAANEEASFLGIPYTKQLKLTTFDQAREIVEDLQAKGIDRVSVRYLGWTNSGLDNEKIPNKADPLSGLGGKKAFDSLLSFMEQTGQLLYPDVDLVHFRSGGRGISQNGDSIRTPFRQIAYHQEYMLSVYAPSLKADPFRLLTASRIPMVADRYRQSHVDAGYTAIGLGTMGQLYYSNLDPEKQDYRSILADTYTAVFKQFQEEGVAMAFENANAYALPYADRVVAAPVYSSNYDLFTRDVPFYQIVLKGVLPVSVPAMTQSADPAVNFLKAVETGSELLYIGIHNDAALLMDTQYSDYFGTTYTLWADEAAAYYARYAEVLEKTNGQRIVRHEEKADGVFVTAFENGVQVTVNYNQPPCTVDGKTVGGLDFLLEGGTEG